MNKYLIMLENWLKKWRLSMSPTKCQYIIFTKNVKDKKFMINLRLMNGIIPKVDSVKFLGVSLDKNLSLKTCTNELIDKCNSRLKIIKILSHKSWKLDQKTLINIYYALVRSIIDYFAIIFPLLCETNKNKIRSVQYHALRFVCKQPLKISHKFLLDTSKVSTIDERCNNLNKTYIENAIINENELVKDLCKTYLDGFPISRSPKFKTILCYYREVVQNYAE
jgi:hypothetical protein